MMVALASCSERQDQAMVPTVSVVSLLVVVPSVAQTLGVPSRGQLLAQAARIPEQARLVGILIEGHRAGHNEGLSVR